MTLNVVERARFPFGNEGCGIPPAGHKTHSVFLGTLSFLHKGILEVKTTQGKTLFRRKF